MIAMYILECCLFRIYDRYFAFYDKRIFVLRCRGYSLVCSDGCIMALSGVLEISLSVQCTLAQVAILLVCVLQLVSFKGSV